MVARCPEEVDGPASEGSSEEEGADDSRSLSLLEEHESTMSAADTVSVPSDFPSVSAPSNATPAMRTRAISLWSLSRTDATSAVHVTPNCHSRRWSHGSTSLASRKSSSSSWPRVDDSFKVDDS